MEKLWQIFRNPEWFPFLLGQRVPSPEEIEAELRLAEWAAQFKDNVTPGRPLRYEESLHYNGHRVSVYRADNRPESLSVFPEEVQAAFAAYWFCLPARYGPERGIAEWRKTGRAAE